MPLSSVIREGFLLINKTSGATSFGVVKKVRKHLGGAKVGHAGTLDPLATGLLILAVGKSTKKIHRVMGLEKEYDFTMRFGLSTTTDDIQGEKIKEEDPSGITAEAIRAALSRFRGTIAQRPPNFSAVKVQGKRAYALARDGEQFDLKEKMVSIRFIDLMETQGPLARIQVICSKGTYMRSLARDLGIAMGVGGCITRIERTRIGPFTLSMALSEDRIEPDILRESLLTEESLEARLSTFEEREAA